MYLARHHQKDGSIKYFIRHSYQDKSDAWLSKSLFSLGHDPEEFIVYVGDRSFYIDPAVEEAISSQGVVFNYDELEKIFMPFLDPEIRRVVEQFDRHWGKRRRYSRVELAAMQKDIHPFDRRRLCFLKFCHTKIENLSNQPFPFFNILLNKSRDEIEQVLEGMEYMLNPREKREYLYAIFDIPRRFAPRLTRFIPDAQDQDLIDKYLLEEICRLDQDSIFLDQGAVPSKAKGLHPYLRKYLIQYFDVLYKWPTTGGSAWHNTMWQPPARSSDEKHFRAMGISAGEFSRMKKKEFTLLFRRKALELHPDKGGSHEAFIALQQAYQVLIRRKT
ncbi:MAG: J domain-containing protein [Dissulfuribacterales bacterium]